MKKSHMERETWSEIKREKNIKKWGDREIKRKQRGRVKEKTGKQGK